MTPRSVNREDIIKGTEELGVDLDEHINFIVEIIKPKSVANMDIRPSRAPM